MKISFYTLGCKLNWAETEELKKDLGKLGYSVVPYDTEEDICIIRGCGVTCSASQKTRNIIRHSKRQGAYVVVIGCVEDKNLAEIDFVAKDKCNLIDHLKKEFVSNSINSHQISDDIVERTRAFIKIQTGCNFNCAYCIIPSFRGKNQSISPTQIIKKINQAVADGYKEVVLTGVNICQYSFLPISKGEVRRGFLDLSDLLKLILNKTEIERIRLGSLDPRLISRKLINLYSQSLNLSIIKSFNRLLPHWHLSLQSGSDTVLKRMNRNYTAKKYLDVVKKLRKTYPPFSFTTDIIVGFPGETDKEFDQTCDFVKAVEFSKVHVFPFSARPKTVAANMPDQTNDKIKTARAKKLTTIANKIGQDFANKFIGLERPVLTENKNLGYTPEFIKIKLNPKKDLPNEIRQIKISKQNLANII
ncbi:MAG: tRNA (N(6)-L-threonylcarbamoyladenosine(37)-C(2))-methylthiotransferase MtaB [Candidatus Magasanikiibacteriota bacterium]